MQELLEKDVNQEKKDKEDLLRLPAKKLSEEFQDQK